MGTIHANLKKTLIALTVILATTAWGLAAMQVTIMPGSVGRGERLLQDKNCIQCHSLDGRGGKRAPDFVRSSGRSRTPALFASAMWNHGPKMWSEFQSTGQPVPALESGEVADIFAYLYSRLYFSPQGSMVRGRNVFEEKQCIGCHGEILDTRSRRLGLDSWTELRNPITWAERMWNHANEMDSATTNRGITWPKLSEQDVVDLLMFLSRLPETQTQLPGFNVGEPELGRVVFERSCESCHTFGGADRSRVDLLGRPAPSSITGYIAAMWNHAPQMRRSGGATAQLNTGEMPDLIAFLFLQRYFQDRGNASKGRRLYEDKGCMQCHETRRREIGAPDLSQATEVYSPITLSSAAWKHGPSMMEKMRQQKIAWPEFNGSEMTDLITYLNSQLVPRVARGPSDWRSNGSLR
jgi:mono/diheme cytochrome c family protein